MSTAQPASEATVRRPRKREGIDYSARDIYLALCVGKNDKYPTIKDANGKEHPLTEKMTLGAAAEFFDLQTFQLKFIALTFFTKNMKEFAKYGNPSDAFESTRVSGGNEVSVAMAYMKQREKVKDPADGKFKPTGAYILGPDGKPVSKPMGLRATIPNHMLEEVGAADGDRLVLSSVNKAEGTITFAVKSGKATA